MSSAAINICFASYQVFIVMRVLAIYSFQVVDLKEQYLCIKFCIQVKKVALESCEILKTAVSSNALGRTHAFE
jgi:hypothetical protein